MKTLLDTNVIVDTLQQREPMFVASSKVIIAIATNQLQGLYYIEKRKIEIGG